MATDVAAPKAPNPLDSAIQRGEVNLDESDFITLLDTEEEAVEAAIAESMQADIPIISSSSLHSITPRIPKIPYSVNLLLGSQQDYGCYSSCSFVAVLFVQYLNRSTYRDVGPIEWWLKIGCYLYEKNIAKIKRFQSKNPHVADDFLNPKDAATVIETTRTGLVYIEELTGILHDPEPNQTVDLAFMEENAFLPLERILRRLFFHALKAPVACTFVSSTEYIHAIGIRWRAEVSELTRDRVRAQLCPNGIDAYDTTERPFLAELDESIHIKNMFLIDLIDSHSNNGYDGMPTSCKRNTSASAVWIEFYSLCDLADYLRARYPRRKDERVSDDLFRARKNSFDMVVWKQNPDLSIQSREIDILLNDPYFKNWATAADQQIKRTKKSS